MSISGSRHCIDTALTSHCVDCRLFIYPEEACLGMHGISYINCYPGSDCRTYLSSKYLPGLDASSITATWAVLFVQGINQCALLLTDFLSFELQSCQTRIRRTERHRALALAFCACDLQTPWNPPLCIVQGPQRRQYSH